MIGVLRYFTGFVMVIVGVVANGQWSDSTLIKTNYLNGLNSIDSLNNNQSYRHNSKEKSDSFYDSLEAMANKKKWSRELHRLLIKNPSEIEAKKGNGYDRINYFAKFEGKKIRNIYIIQLEAFGPSIFDTTRKPEYWYEKMGNSLHVSTNKTYLEKNLFISEGEKLDPYILTDNERILRNISSLQDVRIYVIPINDSPDSVDIKIITKDVLAFGFSLEMYDISYGQAHIWNTNMLGLGHNLHYTAFYNFNSDSKYGYSIRYKIPNISHTFTKLELSHTNRKDMLASGIKIDRDFFTPAIRIAGGIGYEKVKKTFNLATIDTIIEGITSHYEYYDLWGGYSFPVKRLQKTKVRKSYFITGRGQVYTFFERPDISEDYLYDFYDRTLFLTSIGVTWQGYHSTRLVYGFGDTEDLPFGAMIKLTGGYEQNEFKTRNYLGSTITVAKCFTRFGYLSNTLDIGGFYTDNIEQGAINYSFLHISPLFGNSRHEFRHFTSINYIQGINRYDDEFTIIETNNGIRGLRNNLLKGDKRLYLNAEMVYYSPYYLYGFRFVYFLFADVGMINHVNKAIFNNPVYSSAGIGVRIRNERLVFNTIQIQLNFFPSNPSVSNGEKEYIRLTTTGKIRVPELANRKPEIVEY